MLLIQRYFIIFLFCTPIFANSSPTSIPNEGLQAEQKGEWQKAIAIYTNSLIHEAHNSFLWLKVAQLEYQLKNYPLAINAYQHAARIESNNPSIHKRLSEIYGELNQPKNALAEIKKATQLNPDDPDYLLSQAQFANWNKEPTTALSSYEKVLALKKKINPLGDFTALLTQIAHLKAELQPNSSAKNTYNEKKLSPFEQQINLANNEASLHHYAKAAEAMKQAIQLTPKDPTLYRKLSAIYSTAKEPRLALNAMNQALALAPNHIEYLRERAQLAAWANDKVQMQESYERILRLKPDDENALLNLAFVYAWQGRTDKALKAYHYFLSLYPNNAEGWIQYAEPLSWVGSYKYALYALNRYKALHGDENRYWMLRARILALAGYYHSAGLINDPLLHKAPNDPYLLTTETTLQMNGLQTKNAMDSLKRLKKASPDYFQLRGLEDIFLTPLRSNINLGANNTSATDTTRVDQIPTLAGQYFINPTTSLLFTGFYEYATAATGSGLNTIEGNDSIFDENIMFGFTKQISSVANLRALIGDVKIQSKNNHAIYDALINTNLNETAQITLDSSYNLYRPYLVPQSPRLISLQIMESRLGGLLQWQPFMQKYLNLIVSHSNLTDTNAYWHVLVWPKARVFSSQKWQVTLGANRDSWDFSKRLSDGYYSPLHFQGYEGTVDLYYGLSENIGCSISTGFGMQKDETFTRFYYEEDLAAQLFIGIFTDWELKLNVGFTLRNNPTDNYRAWGSGFILTRRF